MEELSRNKWKQRAPTSTRPHGSAFCSRNGPEKTHYMSRLSQRSKTSGLSGTLFFSRSFRAFLHPFRAFSRPFRAKLLDHFLSYQATSGAKLQYHACQSRSTARRYSVFPKGVHGPTLSSSHATGQRIFAMRFFHR